MSEQKHTPGPWKYADAKIPLSGKRNEIRNGQGYLIAYINIGMSDYVANAELIAQAPDLLAKVSLLETLLESEKVIHSNWKKEYEKAVAKVSGQETQLDNLTKENAHLAQFLELSEKLKIKVSEHEKEIELLNGEAERFAELHRNDGKEIDQLESKVSEQSQRIQQLEGLLKRVLEESRTHYTIRIDTANEIKAALNL